MDTLVEVSYSFTGWFVGLDACSMVFWTLPFTPSVLTLLSQVGLSKHWGAKKHLSRNIHWQIINMFIPSISASYIFTHTFPNISCMSQFHILILLMEEILHQLIGSLDHYLQAFIHPRWCRISSINTIMTHMSASGFTGFCSLVATITWPLIGP